MSKFIKSLAVISALAIFATGFTSCKNDEDNDSNTSTTNTGFEGTYYNVYAINNLKDSPKTASCGVEVINFKTDASADLKSYTRKYEEELGNITQAKDVAFYYTKSDSTLIFTPLDEDVREYTIENENTIKWDGRVYEKDAITEVYAIAVIDTDSATTEAKAYILRKDGTYLLVDVSSKIESFQRGSTTEKEVKNGTYTKSGTTITFKESVSDNEITGTVSVDSGITYLTIGEEEYRKL